jgi:hypothetical protein
VGMADTNTTPTSPKATLPVVCFTLLALLAGIVALAQVTTGQQSRCDKAEAAVDDVLQAMAVHGADDPDLARLYRQRNADHIEACS